MSLNEILQRATDEHWAVGHFNISTLEQLRAIVEAAKEVQAPVMIGTSEGERAFMGLHQAVALIEAFRKETGLPIFLNADHSKSFDRAKEAIDAGYDSIHVDGSALRYEENVAMTKKVVDYGRAKVSAISIEGELGYLPTESSRIYKEIVEIKPESLTDPSQAGEFVTQTGIDRFAPAVGNLHGIAANEPKLDFERIAAIRKAIPKEVALVLHGGSGIPDADFGRSIQEGIANVHINTEIRIAFTTKLREFLLREAEETTPYKCYEEAIRAVKDKVRERLKIFGSYGKVGV